MKIGTSFYQAIKYSMRDNKWFIREIAKRGGNATEYFILFTWQYGWTNANPPYIRRGSFTDNTYPNYIFPMWDLDQFDERIWNKWRKIWAYCKERGITPFIRIEDFCSFKTSFNKRLYWNYASYQRHVIKPMLGKEGKKWYEDYTWDARKRLEEKVIITLFEAGLKRGEFFIVPMNEWGTLDKTNQIEHSLKYHRFFAKGLSSLGVSPKKHMIISTSHGAEELHNMGYRIEVHGINSPERLNERYFDGCFANGDGQDPFARGWRGATQAKREPSFEQGIEMGKFLKERDAFGYCYFNRFTEAKMPAKFRRAKFEALEGLIEGINS